jgi:hypothetical protein
VLYLLFAVVCIPVRGTLTLVNNALLGAHFRFADDPSGELFHAQEPMRTRFGAWV